MRQFQVQSSLSDWWKGAVGATRRVALWSLDILANINIVSSPHLSALEGPREISLGQSAAGGAAPGLGVPLGSRALEGRRRICRTPIPRALPGRVSSWDGSPGAALRCRYACPRLISLRPAGAP